MQSAEHNFIFYKYFSTLGHNQLQLMMLLITKKYKFDTLSVNLGN